MTHMRLVALSLVLNDYGFLRLQNLLNFDFIFARSFLGWTQRFFILFTCLHVQGYWFFHLVLLTGTSKFFSFFCLLLFEDKCYYNVGLDAGLDGKI